MIRTLLSGGYNVYAVDWRGYGKSGGKPEYKGVLKDTEAAFDDFISLVRRDSLKVIVYGMSLGGQVATKLVSERQQDVHALVLDGCLSSAQNLAIDFMPVDFIRNSMKKNTKSFNQDYIAEVDIQKITAIPKLIIHSTTDEVVRFYHGERLYEKAREPKFLWKTNTRHIRTLEELPDETINKMNQLLLH
jgi:alpha-beta hydrolase superfamily lysophospholipase